MWWCCTASAGRCGSRALPLCFAYDFKEGDGYQASSTRNERVTCLVPIGVVFSADYMKKVAFGERQFLGVAGIWFIVVECFDHLDHLTLSLRITQER